MLKPNISVTHFVIDTKKFRSKNWGNIFCGKYFLIFFSSIYDTMVVNVKTFFYNGCKYQLSLCSDPVNILELIILNVCNLCQILSITKFILQAGNSPLKTAEQVSWHQIKVKPSKQDFGSAVIIIIIIIIKLYNRFCPSAPYKCWLD